MPSILLIAIKIHASPIKFGRRVPLGVNMAMRCEAIARIGGFDQRIGRKAGTLLGQEVRE